MFEMTVRVAGVTFKNEDGTPRQDLLGVLYDDYWTEGREDEIAVELCREPDNEVDPNAVGVHVVAPEVAAGRVGFVPADQAEYLSQALAARRVRRVELEHMGTGAGARVYARLTVKVLDGNDSPDAGCTVEDDEGRVYDLVDETGPY